MPLLRRLVPLLLAVAAACTGRVEPSPSPAQPAASGTPSAPPAEPTPADPADALVPTLTQEKLDRLLVAEEELLPVLAARVALASAAGAGGAYGRGQASREEEAVRLDGEVAQTLGRHGLTRADRAGLNALAGGIVQRSAKAAAARDQLARSAELAKAAAKSDAAARKGKEPERRPEWVNGKGTQPLDDAMVQHLRIVVTQADADRAAFAAKHGAAALELLDRNTAKVLAVREKQVRLVAGASSSAR